MGDGDRAPLSSHSQRRAVEGSTSAVLSAGAHAHDFGTPRSQRQADADLARALGDRAITP